MSVTATATLVSFRTRSPAPVLALAVAVGVSLLAISLAHAEPAASTTQGAALVEADYDPFDSALSTIEFVGAETFDAQPAVYDPFEQSLYVAPHGTISSGTPEPLPAHPTAKLFDGSPIPPKSTKSIEPLHRVIFHRMPAPAVAQDGVEETLPDPCFGSEGKRPTELTINIAMPTGEFPRDYAGACWQQIDAHEGRVARNRDWATFAYHWNATALCHRPLYFEEINLERYGYGCTPCLQPVASAAHFFGTVPALPYCMVANCPNECVYTLGHYRPGTCPPWQTNYPPCIGVK